MAPLPRSTSDRYPISNDWANRIYDVLVEVCFAPEGQVYEKFGPLGIHRLSFVQHQEDGCLEYRFGGRLLFGGKFWNANGGWYVNCYQEDETPERRACIEKANTRLAALHQEWLSSLRESDE